MGITRASFEYEHGMISERSSNESQQHIDCSTCSLNTRLPPALPPSQIMLLFVLALICTIYYSTMKK